MFTKEHYNYLAKWCGECVADSEVWHSLAGRLKLSESAFNYDLFIDACYAAAGAKLAKDIAKDIAS